MGRVDGGAGDWGRVRRAARLDLHDVEVGHRALVGLLREGGGKEGVLLDDVEGLPVKVKERLLVEDEHLRKYNVPSTRSRQ